MEITERVSEVMHLPEDMQTEVLLRLPVKILLRFRCVCKSWCYIIYNPTFITRHVEVNKNRIFYDENNVVLALEGGSIAKGTKFTKYPIRKLRQTTPEIIKVAEPSVFYGVRGSVNGVLLVEHQSYNFMEPSIKQSTLLLWNPTIRRSLALPPCPLNSKYDKYALGFNPSTNDYKVVVFPECPLDQAQLSFRIAVHVLGTSLWTRKTIHLDFPISWRIQDARNKILFSQGAFNWLVSDHTREDHHLKSYKQETHMVSFDLDTEKLSFVELPYGGEDIVRFSFLLGELVALFDVSDIHSCIWVMEKERERTTWTKWYSGGSSFYNSQFFRRSWISTFMYVPKSGMFIIGHELVRETMLYNIRSHEIKHFGVMNNQDYVILYMEIHVESLVLAERFGVQKMT